MSLPPIRALIPHRSALTNESLIQRHLQALGYSSQSDVGSAPTSSLQLQQPQSHLHHHYSSRRSLIQGELISIYLLIPHAIRDRYSWLQLPWGQRLKREARERGEEVENEDEEGADEATKVAGKSPTSSSILHHLHPAPLSLRLSLRKVSSAEAASIGDEEILSSIQPIPFSMSQFSMSQLNQQQEEQEANDETEIVHRSENDDNSELEATAAGSDNTIASEATTQSSTPLRRSSASVVSSSSHASQHQFAFRKSLSHTPLPSASHSSAATTSSFHPSSSATPTLPHLHHPSRLTPGYAPQQPSNSELDDGDEEQRVVWTHMQGEQHAAPSEGVEKETSVWYFYADLNSKDSTPSAASPPTLILYLRTRLSILPSALSSCFSDSSSQQHLLALEVRIKSPVAEHHTQLVENVTFNLSAVAGIEENPIYSSIRQFIKSNRALQVPHAIQPARLYVNVFEPLHLTTRAIHIGGGSGDGASTTDSDEKKDSNTASNTAGSDVVFEFALRNTSNTMVITIDSLEFLLNRTKILLRVLNATASLQQQQNDIKSNSANNFSSSSNNEEQQQRTRSQPRAIVGEGGNDQGAAGKTGLERSRSAARTTDDLTGNTFSLSPSPSLIPTSASFSNATPAPSPMSSPSKQRHKRGKSSGASSVSSVHYVSLAQYFQAENDSTVFPIVLQPHEEVRVLYFLSSSSTSSPPLQQRLRDILLTGGASSASAALFSLTTSSVPFRTPVVARYRVTEFKAQLGSGHEVVEEKKQQLNGSIRTSASPSSSSSSSSGPISLQTKVIWRMPSSACSPSESKVWLYNNNIPLSSNINGILNNSLPKLSLRMKVSSPVRVHHSFPVFLTITNHSSFPTKNLQLVLLPNAHHLVGQAMRKQRERRRRGENESGEKMEEKMGASHPASALLYTPAASHTMQQQHLYETPVNHSHALRSHQQHHPPQHKPHSTSFPFLSNSSTSPPAVTMTNKRSDSMLPLGSSILTTQQQDGTDSSSSSVFTTSLSHFISDGTDASVEPSKLLAEGTDDLLLSDVPLQASDEDAEEAAKEERERQSDEGQPEGKRRKSRANLSYPCSSPFALPFLVSLSSLICLSSRLSLGVLAAGESITLTLHFLALREGLLPLATLALEESTQQIEEGSTRKPASQNENEASVRYFLPKHIPTLFAVKS